MEYKLFVIRSLFSTNISAA